jgi:hypothetical protein
MVLALDFCEGRFSSRKAKGEERKKEINGDVSSIILIEYLQIKELYHQIKELYHQFIIINNLVVR